MQAARFTALGLVLLLMGGCTSGSKSVNQKTDFKVTVYVSNQSPVVDPVDLKVLLDEVMIADQAFAAGNLHSWTSFEVSVPPGVHPISVRSDAGSARVDTSLSIADTAWVLVSYWNDPTSINNPTGPKLTVELRNEAPVFK